MIGAVIHADGDSVAGAVTVSGPVESLGVVVSFKAPSFSVAVELDLQDAAELVAAMVFHIQQQHEKMGLKYDAPGQ